MNVPAPTLEELESESLFDSLVERLRFSEAVGAWSRCRQSLTRWEDQHLLVDKPAPELLERHRAMVERLMFFGQLFAFVASHPEFKGLETAEMIQANQFILREKFQMFHQPNQISREEADLILREVFPES